MKFIVTIFILIACLSCKSDREKALQKNPFIVDLNESVKYADATAEDLKAYAEKTMVTVISGVDKITSSKELTFENTFIAYDDLVNEMTKTMNNCYMLYWVSPDSLIRAYGLSSYQKLDSLSNQINSNKDLYQRMKVYLESDEYRQLPAHRAKLVKDLIQIFEQSGVNLPQDQLEKFKALNAEVTDLSIQYSINMNTASLVLNLDKEQTTGLPENFRETYAVGEHDYEIPVIPATRMPVMNNAASEQVRRDYITKYYNRGADKNLEILDKLISKRHEIGLLMGCASYAEYKLKPKMAKHPENVWDFVNGLVDKTRPKAIKDYQKLMHFRNRANGVNSSNPINPWDLNYYPKNLPYLNFRVYMRPFISALLIRVISVKKYTL